LSCIAFSYSADRSRLEVQRELLAQVGLLPQPVADQSEVGARDRLAELLSDRVGRILGDSAHVYHLRRRVFGIVRSGPDNSFGRSAAEQATRKLLAVLSACEPVVEDMRSPIDFTAAIEAFIVRRLTVETVEEEGVEHHGQVKQFIERLRELGAQSAQAYTTVKPRPLPA